VTRTLQQFIDELDSRRRRIVVVNGDDVSEEVADIVAYFDRLDLETAAVTATALPESFLVLTDGEEFLGAIGVADLHEYLFASFTDDTFRMLDAGVRASAAIEGFLGHLDGNVYSLSGDGKLPIASVSQLLETRAWHRGTGTLHAGFQRLSNLRSDSATLTRYRKLAECGVETSVYGRPDWTPSEWTEIAAYGDESGDHLEAYWFVVYRGPEATDDGAVLAREDADGRYTGFWTFDSETVAALAETLVEEYQPRLTPLSGPASSGSDAS
jgi:hypothetical protein